MRPVRRHVYHASACHFLDSAATVGGLHDHVSGAAEAEVYFGGFCDGVVVAFGHEELVADSSGLEFAYAVHELAGVFWYGDLEYFVVERVVIFGDEFFQGFVNHAGVTLHADALRGRNSHHVAETLFKAFGRALRMALEQDSRMPGELPSTKGAL